MLLQHPHQPAAFIGELRHHLGEALLMQPRRHQSEVRLVRRAGQHFLARFQQQFAGIAVVHHLEMRGEAGFQRETAQQRLAEGVDGLDPHAARRIEQPGEQPPRPDSLIGRGVGPSSGASSLSSAASSAVAQSARRAAMRLAISEAAALVKVRQRRRSGGLPASSSASTRSVSTLVLPVPAEAATHTEERGSAARRWRCRDRGHALTPTLSRKGRGRIKAFPLPSEGEGRVGGKLDFIPLPPRPTIRSAEPNARNRYISARGRDGGALHRAWPRHRSGAPVRPSR